MKATLFNIVEICESHQVEITFIRDLQQSGLLEITVMESEEYIHEEQLPRLEKYANLYYELELNVQALEVIENLLDKIETLQNEILELKGHTLKR